MYPKPDRFHRKYPGAEGFRPGGPATVGDSKSVDNKGLWRFGPERALIDFFLVLYYIHNMNAKFCLVVLLMALVSFPLLTVDLDGTVVLRSSLNSIAIEYAGAEGGEEMTDTLNYITMGVSFSTDITESLKVGIGAGYSLKKYTGPLYFEQLPLSLMIEDQSFNSMYFSLLGDYRFFYVQNFSFNLSAEVNYFKLFEINRELSFPVVSGEGTVQNSFLTGTLDLLIKFDQVEGLTIFAGPELHLLSGRFKALETLEDLSGEESVTFRQDRFFALLAGVQVEVLGLFEVKVEAKFLSHFSIRGGVIYEF